MCNGHTSSVLQANTEKRFYLTIFAASLAVKTCQVISVRLSDGAGDGTQTRGIQLGRLALYQLSYSCIVVFIVVVVLMKMYLAGAAGFEPTTAVLETAVLPIRRRP